MYILLVQSSDCMVTDINYLFKLKYCYMDQLITDQLTVVYDAGCRAKDVRFYNRK